MSRRSRPSLGRPQGAEGAETKRRILHAALDLFASKGFEATTTRDIANKAGLSDAGLYAHFASKRALFDELFRKAGPHVAALAAASSPEIPREKGPAAFVMAAVEHVLRRWSEPEARKFMGVVLRECTLNTGRGVPSLSEGIGDALKETAALFARWAREGLLRSDFPPEHLAWELFAPLINLRIAHLNPNSSEADIARGRAFGRRHAEFFLSCVVKRKEEVR